MATALEEQNMDGITEANWELDLALEETENYLKELEILADKNNVDFDIE